MPDTHHILKLYKAVDIEKLFEEATRLPQSYQDEIYKNALDILYSRRICHDLNINYNDPGPDGWKRAVVHVCLLKGALGESL